MIKCWYYIAALLSYLRPFKHSIGDHVGIFIDTAVPRVDTEQEAAHAEEKEQNYCGPNPFPAQVHVWDRSIG